MSPLTRLHDGHQMRWARARTLADIADQMIAWLHGETLCRPGHSGPPGPETAPHTGVLAAATRAGFVTAEIHPATPGQQAHVTGFAAEWAMAWLSAVTGACQLAITACQGSHHSGHPGGGPGCPAGPVLQDYRESCPRATGALDAAWTVQITDPQPGRDDRLWPALDIFAAEVGIR